MGRPHVAEDNLAIAQRWFPEMAPLPGSVASAAARRLDTAPPARDVLLVSADSRFVVSHRPPDERRWSIRDGLTGADIASTGIAQIRLAYDQMVSAFNKSREAIACSRNAVGETKSPVRVVLRPLDTDDADSLLWAEIWFEDNEVLTAGLFESVDRTKVDCLLNALGLPTGVPTEVAR